MNIFSRVVAIILCIVAIMFQIVGETTLAVYFAGLSLGIIISLFIRRTGRDD